MTRPIVAKAAVQVTAEAAKDLASNLERDLNRAVRSVDINPSILGDKISAGAKVGAAGADRALAGLAGDVNDTFAKISREASRAFDHTAADATAAGAKIGSRMQVGGEVAERALQELDRTAGREFQQIATKAGAAASATSSKWVAAWSVIKGAALAAGAATAAGLTAMTVFGLKAAGALEQTTIGLESLLGSTAAATSFIKELQSFAAATPFEFADVADASRRILAFGAAVGITRKQVIPTLTTIGDLVSVLGGTSENVNSVIRALGQMASKGKVSQEEILQLAEALPGFNANAAIAASLGLSVADTLKLITAGGVDAKTGIDALLKGMANFGGASGAMAKQALTLNGVFSTFKDTIAIALTDAFTPVLPAIKKTLTDLTPVIGDAVRVLAPVIGQLLTDVLPLIGIAIRDLSPILGIMVKLATTLLTALAPAAEALAPVIQRLLDGMQPLALAIGTFLSKAIQSLIDSGALDTLVDQMIDLVPAVIDLLIALTPLLPPLADLLTLFLQMQRPGIQLLALLVGLSTAASPKPLQGFAGSVAELLHTFTQFSKIASDIHNWPKIFKADWEKVGPAVGKAASAVGDFFAGIGRFLATIPGKIGSFLASLPGIVGGAFKAAADAALHAIGFGLGLIIGLLLAFPQLALAALVALPGLIGGFLTSTWESLKTSASTAWDAIVAFFTAAPGRIWAAIQALPGLIGGAFTAARDRALAALSAIVAFALSVPSRIAALAGAMFAAGLAMIKGLFSGLGQAGGFVGDLAGKITGAIKGMLNRVIGGINSGIASVDDALPGISLPRLPSLATGGLTTDGGLANLHPRELVLPLEDRRVVDLLARAMQVAAAGGGASAAPVGAGTPAFDVRVFIGDTELKGLINVEISERNRATKARVQAGSGRR